MRQLCLYSISDLFAFNTKSFPLASRRLSLTHTFTHPPFPLPPSPQLSGERQLDRPIHLRKAASATDFSSALAPAGPASPKRGSCRGGSGQEEEALRLAALRPQDADLRIRCPFPPLADRSQLMLSETLHGVHLAATPGQLQLLNPASKCCGESPTQPSCCPFRHRGLEGRKEIPPLPRPLQAGTLTTGKMRVQTSNTGEQVLPGHFAKGGKDEKGARVKPMKQIEIKKREVSRLVIKASSPPPTPGAVHCQKTLVRFWKVTVKNRIYSSQAPLFHSARLSREY